MEALLGGTVTGQTIELPLQVERLDSIDLTTPVLEILPVSRNSFWTTHDSSCVSAALLSLLAVRYATRSTRCSR